MSLLAVCPSRGRPDAARELLASFEATRRDKRTRLVFVLDSDDPTRTDYPGEVYLAKPGGSYVPALNQAARDPALVRDATAIGFVGDDVRFVTPGWDVTLGDWLTDNIGIAWGDDGWDHPWSKEDKASHWWVSRPIVDVFGLAPAGLRHFYPDDFWAQLGWAAGCARYFPDVLIEHLHPMAGKGSQDDTYARPRRFIAFDKRWWARWQRRGKAHDVARLRRIIDAAKPAQPRRVLADWHHPALWESLSILFEDRFGWELYSPHGIEWTEHGWRFEREPFSAEWFLTQPATEADDHQRIIPPEYPARPRKAVTWAQANAMRWDFVLASVAQHQRPFAELARHFGARLIHQVGNARHWVNPREPQVILASSNAVTGRGVIRYHQEFSLDLFGHRPAKDRRRVSSFMLRMAEASCDYSWLPVEQHGVEMGHPDYLAPMSRVADAMARSGWVWHDKRIGDGYGHVVHNAAAMGRPLIGHASHYKGQMAEPFWRDLETCIDLDRHPPERAQRLIKAISADRAWHDAMGRELADTFTRLVDFDSEAAAIRAALA